MAYTEEDNAIVIDGFQNGIAASPYLGIANIRGFNTSYYPGVAYVNYRRRAATLTSTSDWYAGTHSTNVSNNVGWIFTAPATPPVMGNPVQQAVSPAGLIYIQDYNGVIWKQTAVNSTSFTQLDGGSGRFGSGNAGLAYWNNYLVVFGDGVIEFCGNGTGDAGVVSSNWNVVSNANLGSSGMTTNYGSHPNNVYVSATLTSYFGVNDQVTFTTTGALPSPLVVGTTYYVLSVDLTNEALTISTSVGGAAVIFTNDGSGSNTITVLPPSMNLPLGSSTNASFLLSPTSNVLLILESYTNQVGTVISNGIWQEASGLYNIVLANGQTVPANFTNGSYEVNLLSPLIYFSITENLTGVSIQLLNPTVTDYRPYVSKVDGSLYFCNGQYIGRIAEATSPNLTFNPGQPGSYSLSAGVTSIPEQFTDTVVDMVDLKNSLVVAGRKDVYVWDYLGASTSSPSPVGEPISRIVNLLNNVYILAGQKGNIYISNGYSAQLLYKLSDFMAGIIDPVWTWGGIMSHRSRLFFQALAQTTTGTNILAGIFSLTVSPSMIGETASGLVMENQNSYGLTPASGASGVGLLIDNSPSASGNDSYYSTWSNGSNIGGIDYNDTSLWQNYEPTIETDIIPIGTILDKKTFGNIEFKLDRPLATGDFIKLYGRTSLSDSYTLIGTTSTAQLSEYFSANIFQGQWVQFKVTMKCASSGSSFIPLREIRLTYN